MRRAQPPETQVKIQTARRLSPAVKDLSSGDGRPMSMVVSRDGQRGLPILVDGGRNRNGGSLLRLTMRVGGVLLSRI